MAVQQQPGQEQGTTLTNLVSQAKEAAETVLGQLRLGIDTMEARLESAKAARAEHIRTAASVLSREELSAASGLSMRQIALIITNNPRKTKDKASETDATSEGVEAPGVTSGTGAGTSRASAASQDSAPAASTDDDLPETGEELLGALRKG